MQNNTFQQHMSVNKQSSTQQTPQQSRLELYNTLFGQSTSKKKADETGLQSQQSLNYSLYTFLHLSDINWVLSIVDIADLHNFDEKYGYQSKQRKVIQIANVIKKFCENDPRKLKAFKCNNVIVDHDIHDTDDESKRDLFALLMYCYPKLVISEKYISKLIDKIKQQTNELVFVGIAKMNNWETFEEWKKRAIKNVNNAKNTSTLETEIEAKTDKNNNNLFYFSDIDIAYVNPNADEKSQEKQQQRTGVVVKKLEQKKNLI